MTTSDILGLTLLIELFILALNFLHISASKTLNDTYSS